MVCCSCDTGHHSDGEHEQEEDLSSDDEEQVKKFNFLTLKTSLEQQQHYNWRDNFQVHVMVNL
jgi:hypothetical protein